MPRGNHRTGNACFCSECKSTWLSTMINADVTANVSAFNKDRQRLFTDVSLVLCNCVQSAACHLTLFLAYRVCSLRSFRPRSPATMSEKPSHERVSRDLDESPIRKASVSRSIGSHVGKSKAEEVARIDKLATAPGVTLESFAHLDEKKILRKMDWHLIPMLALLYLLSFLDRGNIGNAKIEGLQETLGMTGAQYNWCLTAFFFT